MQLGQRAVAQARRRFQVGPALRLLNLLANVLDPLLGLPDRGNRGLFLLPLLPHPGAIAFQDIDLSLEFGQALPARRICLFLERLAFDLQLHDAPVDLIQRRRLAIDLRPQAARRLVDEIDGLIREKTVADVTGRQGGGGDHGRVGDAHTVVYLVAVLQTAQDGNRFFNRGLGDEDGLEPPFQGGVLLDVLPVLVQRRRADRAQFAPRQHRLEHVRRIDRAFGRAGADHRVQFVDEQDDLAAALADLSEHGLQAVLKLSAEFRPGQERPQIELHDAFVLEAFGDIAAHDPLRQPLHNRRLADPGIADQDGIVLRAPGEDLNDAADFLVTADDRIQLPPCGHLREVAPVAFEGLVFALRIGVGHALGSPHVPDRPGQRIGCEVGLRQDAGRTPLARARETHQ